MWTRFYLEDFRFVINVFAGFVFFLVSWLYFNAAKSKKDSRDIFKSLGFLLISFSFLVSSVRIDLPLTSIAVVDKQVLYWVFLGLRLLGYTLIVLGLFTSPIQTKPKLAALVFPQHFWTQLSFPVVSLFVSLVYFRNAISGKEKHLTPVAFAFLLLSLSELLSLRSYLQGSLNPDVYNVVAAFGPLWIIENILLTLAVVILGKWVWGYLLRQFATQLFIVFSFSAVTIFLITSVFFTSLIVKNIEDDNLKSLETDVKVLSYSIEAEKAKVQAETIQITSDTRLIDAFVKKDDKVVSEYLIQYLEEKGADDILVVDKYSKVIGRGGDTQLIGQSLSSDHLITQALTGNASTSLVSIEGVMGTSIYIKSVYPLKTKGDVVGAIVVQSILDNAFVDGIKRYTGLDSSVYSLDVISATTINISDSKPIGIKLTDRKILDKVSGKSETFVGFSKIADTVYFSAYYPLIDSNNTVCGMLFAGKPQMEVLETSARGLQTTFIAITILSILSILPSFMVARHLASQIR